MPARMTILVMLGLSMILAMAVHDLRSRSRHPRLVVAAIGALLLFELLPAPRVLYSAEVPAVYRTIAADPRPIRVLSLPFGLRDGLSSRGNFSSSSQFYQTLPREAARRRLHLAPAGPEHRALSAQPHAARAAAPERGNARRPGAVRTGLRRADATCAACRSATSSIDASRVSGASSRSRSGRSRRRWC